MKTPKKPRSTRSSSPETRGSGSVHMIISQQRRLELLGQPQPAIEDMRPWLKTWIQNISLFSTNMRVIKCPAGLFAPSLNISKQGGVNLFIFQRVGMPNRNVKAEVSSSSTGSSSLFRAPLELPAIHFYEFRPLLSCRMTSPEQ